MTARIRQPQLGKSRFRAPAVKVSSNPARGVNVRWTVCKRWRTGYRSRSPSGIPGRGRWVVYVAIRAALVGAVCGSGQRVLSLGGDRDLIWGHPVLAFAVVTSLTVGCATGAAVVWGSVAV